MFGVQFSICDLKNSGTRREITFTLYMKYGAESPFQFARYPRQWQVCLAHFTTFSQVISHNLNFNDSSFLDGYGFKGKFTYMLEKGHSGQIDAYHHHHCELLVPWHPGMMSWFLSSGLHLQLFLSSPFHFYLRISLSCFWKPLFMIQRAHMWVYCGVTRLAISAASL